MAIGITVHPEIRMETWSIPMMCEEDKEWTDNTWIVEHLRHLANKIESENPRIYSIGVVSDAQYKIPCLNIEIFETSK